MLTYQRQRRIDNYKSSMETACENYFAEIKNAYSSEQLRAARHNANSAISFAKMLIGYSMLLLNKQEIKFSCTISKNGNQVKLESIGHYGKDRIRISRGCFSQSIICFDCADGHTFYENQVDVRSLVDIAKHFHWMLSR